MLFPPLYRISLVIIRARDYTSLILIIVKGKQYYFGMSTFMIADPVLSDNVTCTPYLTEHERHWYNQIINVIRTGSFIQQQDFVYVLS